jgi:hypothetical protein
MLINYYPTYSNLDEIMNLGSMKTINLFIDLKNCIQPLYMKHNMELLIENTKLGNRIDSTLLTDVFSFLTFHKIYAIKREKQINFYIFYETGDSYYHKNIYKYYKIKRKIDAFHGLDKENRDLFFTIMQKNLALIDTALSVIPNTWVMKLENLEADFIPYYLISENLVEPDAYNIIYSNDHDMFQNLELGHNVFQYRRIKKYRDVLKKGDASKTFLKKETHIPDEYFPLMMSITGDTSDDIEGISGVGPSRVVDVVDTFLEHNISMSKIYHNIHTKNNLGLDMNAIQAQNKIIINEDIIVRNLKLISFEYLSKYLNDPPNTEAMDKRKYILNRIQNKKIASIKTISEALTKSKISLMNGNELEILFEK